MPYANRERQLAYQRAHYRLNKPIYRERRKTYRQEMKDIINEFKSTPCADCQGVFDPCQVDLDHLPGHKKVDNISKMIRKNTRKEILAELKKVEAVCSNCHRLRTQRRSEEKRGRMSKDTGTHQS